MKNPLISSFALLSLGITVGCGGSQREIETYNETGFEVSDETEWGADYHEGWGNVDVFQAEISGDIGHLTGIDGDATVIGYSEDSFADLEILTVGANGSAMHLLSFSGGLNHPALVPGAHLQFGGNGYEGARSDGLNVMSTNCSGTGAVYDWDYDAQADRVSIEVSETDEADVLRIDYTTAASSADYGNQNDTSSGSFLLRR